MLATIAQPDPLETFQDCDDCPVMIELPMGEFMMGAPEGDIRRRAVWGVGEWVPLAPGETYEKGDEGPQGQVTIDIPIAMGRDEVTYAQWMACVNDGGCNGYVPPDGMFKMGTVNNGQDMQFIGGDFPVLYVNILDAQAYTDWLNVKTGSTGYRLPTEAEWEYAARAGTTTRYAQGDDLTAEQANFSREVTQHLFIEERPDLVTRGGPVEVHALDAANAWGLRHMSGNVIEMTMSCYTNTFIAHPLASHWVQISESDTCSRVAVRGGNYNLSLDQLRVAWRSATRRNDRTKFTGFRIVKEFKE